MSFEHSFVWVEEGILAFGEKPGRWQKISHDLEFLKGNGIGAIVSLIEEQDGLSDYSAAGFHAFHIPIIDFQPPSLDQISECMNTISSFHANGNAVYVHCYAGLGRSGTMAAAWLIHRGQEPLQAIDAVRRAKLGTIETDAQWNALLEFAATR